MFNKILFFALFQVLSISILLSYEKESMIPPGIIKGLVYDTFSSEPMEFSTIALKRTYDSTLVTGAITDVNGFFRLKDVSQGDYFLEISFMGYERFESDEIKLSVSEGYDIGVVNLRPTDEMLNEVVVVADRPTMTYQIDKKVINVSQLHTSASGSAVEVLENIPSVTVSIEGDVSLRGSSSFTVLIDGKPSILDANDILNQIPASQIENIEIITNPSARFDPNGVAGIINIVMKKNRQQGMNGVVNVNAGTPGRYGGDLLFNYRKERINFFFGADYNQHTYLGASVRENQTIDNVISFLNSQGDYSNNRYSTGLRAGFDFTVNPSSSIGVGYRFSDRERGSESDRLFQEWTSVNANNVFEYSSFEENVRGGFSHSLSLDYKLDFNQEGHGIIANLVLETSDSKDNSINNLFNDAGAIVNGQRSLEAGPSDELNFRFDYTLPISETNKFESGIQASIDNSDESNTVHEFNIDNQQYELNDLYSMNVRYNMAVYALYSTFSGSYNKLGYQAGLRAEYTDRLVNLLGDDDQFPLNRLDLYPTAHLSYDLPGEQQAMASYTRRLQRLRGWYLEPFYTWSDAYNIRIGNPRLNPEYIDSYEISYQFRFANGNVFSTDLYYRVTHNKIERVRSVFNDQANIILSSMENVGQDFSLGTEIMTGFDPTPWWHLDVMVNIYDYRQEGQLNGRDYSTSSFNWNTRLNNDFKITPSTRLQLRGMYNSPSVTAQGERTGYFVTHVAMKQDFLDRDLSVTLQIRDIFGTSSREVIYRDLDFYNYSSWNPQTPFVSLTMSYRINNYAERRGPERGNDSMEAPGDDF
jgi:outer membrane cobalamin receptor